MSKSLRVVFMGTPEFAVTSLDAIHLSNHKIVGVVTVPDKPAGRGQKLSISAVKKYAVDHELNLFQPEKLKNKHFVQSIIDLQPDVIVVVAFRLLPEIIWKIPKLGTFNLHGSLLPQYRGAAPINYAIMNGDKETGVTTFMIDEKIDTGNILLQTIIPIVKEDTSGTLHDRMMYIGANLVVETLDKMANQQIIPKQQSEMIPLHYAHKIYKEDCQINWDNSLESIHNLIRGLSPYPTAFTYFQIGNEKKLVKIFNGNYEISSVNQPIGMIIKENSKIKITHPNGYYFPTEIQVEGKRRMFIADFMNGLQKDQTLQII